MNGRKHTMRHVCIVGLGKIGLTLAHQLVLQHTDVQVYAIKRSATILNVASSGAAVGAEVLNHPRFSLLLGDVSAPSVALQQQLLALPRLDALVVILAPDERTESAYRATYIHSIACLKQHLRHPPQHVVFISSTAVSKVFGLATDAYVDEQSPLNAEALHHAPFNARLLYEAERMWQHCVADDWQGAQLTLIRPSGIYGAGRERLWRALTQPATHAPAFALQQLQTMSHRIHAEDVVGFIHYMLLLGFKGTWQANKHAYALVQLTDNQPEPLGDTLLGMCQLRSIAVPAWLQDYAAHAVPATALLRKLSNTYMQQLGYVLRYPAYTFYDAPSA